MVIFCTIVHQCAKMSILHAIPMHKRKQPLRIVAHRLRSMLLRLETLGMSDIEKENDRAASALRLGLAMVGGGGMNFLHFLQVS